MLVMPICVLVSAYDGPQSYDLNNPDSTTTKVQVLQVTSGHSTTDDFDSDDEEDDIPTISTGEYSLPHLYGKPGVEL